MAQLDAWEAVRNAKHAKADRQFTTANPRVKLKACTQIAYAGFDLWDRGLDWCLR